MTRTCQALPICGTRFWVIVLRRAELRGTAEDLDGRYVRDQHAVWRYSDSLVPVPGATDWVDVDGRLRIDAPELDLDPRVKAVALAEAEYRHVRGLAYDEAETARTARNDAVRTALGQGISYGRIAELTGLSRGRIGLLRDLPAENAGAPDGGWVRSAAFYQRKLPRRRPQLSERELAEIDPLERAIVTAQGELDLRIQHYSAQVPRAYEQRARALREARRAGLSARQVAEICDLSAKRVNEIVAGEDYGRPRRSRSDTSDGSVTRR